MSYGHALKTAGRLDDGVSAYRKSLALEPSLGEAELEPGEAQDLPLRPAGRTSRRP